jgi:hypothetical protein
MKTALPLSIVLGTLLAAGCGKKEDRAPQGPQQTVPTAAPAPTTTTTTTTLPPPIWRTVRWGMTKDEVIGALPGEAQALRTPMPFGPEAQGAADVIIPSQDADGVTYRALFGFEGGGLARIHLDALKPGASTCEEIEQKLTAENGAPAARNAVGTSLRGEEIVWKRPDQTITLACSGVASLGFNKVSVARTPPR